SPVAEPKANEPAAIKHDLGSGKDRAADAAAADEPADDSAPPAGEPESPEKKSTDVKGKVNPGSKDKGGPSPNWPPGDAARGLFGPEDDGPAQVPEGARIDSVEKLEKFFQEADRNQDKRLDATELPMHIINRISKSNSRGVSLEQMKSAFKRLKEK